MNETKQNLSLHLVQRTLNDIKCPKQDIALGPELMCFSCSILRKQEANKNWHVLHVDFTDSYSA